MFLHALPRVSKPRGPAITRSDAFAVVVAKLGFKPSFISRAEHKDVFRRPCDTMSLWPGTLPSCIKGLKPKLARRTHGRGRVSRTLPLYIISQAAKTILIKMLIKETYFRWSFNSI